MPKLIMFCGGVETLTFFSRQLAAYFEEQGWNIFWYDLHQEELCARRLRRFIKPRNTCVLTFNFLGLSGESGVYDERRGYLWEQYKIPCVNIVVDHPLYYSERYDQLPDWYYQISIDRDHEKYLKEYYPEISTLGFLPLAGSSLNCGKEETVEEWLANRPVELLFVGNYNDPAEYEPYITRINEEYTAFYRGILNELLCHPQRTLIEVAKRHCIREMGQLSQKEWRLCFQHLNFMDLYLRFYERQQVLKSLIESGRTVHVYGHGYENFSCSNQEGLICHGPVDSLECLKQMQRSRISLNVMPWFRDGAHDRIFNAMANGSVSLTDSSRYLEETFRDEEDILFYDLLSLEDMTKRVERLLKHPETLYPLSQKARCKVLNCHLWRQRGEWLKEKIESIF